MRKLNSSRDLISTLPKQINQKLIDGYRVKLFAKIKDKLQRDKNTLEQEQIEFKEWLNNKSLNILKPINNSWFTPILRA